MASARRLLNLCNLVRATYPFSVLNQPRVSVKLLEQGSRAREIGLFIRVAKPPRGSSHAAKRKLSLREYFIPAQLAT